MPVCTPILPPGSANAFGVSSSKTDTSQDEGPLPRGAPASTACATHSTYAFALASFETGVFCRISA